MEQIVIDKTNIRQFARMFALEMKDIEDALKEDWISSNKAYKKYGGKSFVESLIDAGEVRFLYTDGKRNINTSDIEKAISKRTCRVGVQVKKSKKK